MKGTKLGYMMEVISSLKKLVMDKLAAFFIDKDTDAVSTKRSEILILQF